MNAAAPTTAEPEVDPTFRVLRETEAWAVVAKSGNLPCHASGRYRTHTLEAALLAAGFPAAHFVSRLDRETSGAVLVAKDPATAGALGRAMMARRIRKRYLCLARGVFPLAPGPDGWAEARGRIVAAGDAVVHKYRVFLSEVASPTSQAASPTLRPATCDLRPPPQTPGAAADAAAATRFRLLPWSRFGLPDAPGFLALECEPLTGRTHQIRATLKGLGLDVVGDKLYGPDRTIYARMCEGAMTADDRARLLLPRQALHAWRIAFPDPATGAEIEVEAPPDDLLAAFAAVLPAPPPH